MAQVLAVADVEWKEWGIMAGCRRHLRPRQRVNAVKGPIQRKVYLCGARHLVMFRRCVQFPQAP